MTDQEKTDLLEAYKKRKTSNRLSANLSNPVPSGIRAECLNIYRQRYRAEDDAILEKFFKKDANGDYTAAITNIDIDRFRPTVDLIRGREFKPEEKHYELIFWLLGAENGQKGRKPANWLANQKITWVSLAALIIAGAITWMIYGSLHPQCMYWTGSEYQAVSCTIHAPGRPVYAIDPRKLDRFKKIMKPDTVTAASVGRIWYFKANHRLELYTDSGTHPILTTRRLKPLTLYMQEKYLSTSSAR